MSTLQTFRRHRKPLGGALAALMAVWQIGQPLQAATYYWNTASGTFTTGANWSDNPTTGGITGIAPGTSDSVVFNQSSVNGAETITIGATTIAGMTFANTGTTGLRTDGTANRLVTLGAGGLTLNAGAGAVTFGTTTNLQRVTFTIGASQIWLNNSSNTLALNNNNTIALGANTLTFDGTGTITTGTGIISGTGGLIKNGTGTLTLAAANTFTTGGITLNAGRLNLNNDAALGGAASVLRIAGGSINVNGARLTTNNNAQVWNGDFTFVGGNTWNTGTGTVNLGINAGGTRTVNVLASTMTVGGVLSNGTNGTPTTDLKKIGAGGLTFTAASGITGLLTVDGGTLTLSGSGSMVSTSGVTIGNRGVFALDNSGTNVADRTAGAINSNGGGINFTANAAATTETLGALTLTAGALTINSTTGAGGSTLTIPSITRAAGGGTLYVNGTGLGGGTNQVVLTTANGLTNTILPWAVVNNGTVTRFATHGGNGTSLAPQTAGYTADQGSWAGTVNALPAVDQTLSNNRVANSLTLDAGIDLLAPIADRNFTLGGVTGFGAVLQTGGDSIIGATGANEHRLVFSTNEAIFHTVGNLTIQQSSGTTANIQGSGGLIKSGAGTLTVTNSSMTGTVSLNEGTYVATAAAGLGGATALVAFNGGSLTLANDASTTMTAAGAIAINADTTISIGRATSGAGVTHVLPGALTMNGRSLTVLEGSLITTDTAYGLTFSSASATTLTGPSSFTIANNGTGLGTITVGTLSGAYPITKLGTGDLVTSSTVSGYTSSVDIQAGRVGWSGGAATFTDSSTFTGAGGLVKSGASIVNLSGASSFAGGITISAGTLGFETVGNNNTTSPSSLGQGTNGITLNGGTLSFVGSTNQATDRTITLTAASTLAANGTSGAVITYNGAIGAAGNTVTLTGVGVGVLNAVITQSGTTADLIKTGAGTWTLGAASAFTLDDVLIRGGTLKLGINAALVSTVDDLGVSSETATGGILDINGTTGSNPTDLLVGSNSGANVYSGSVIDSLGGGSIGANATIGLRRGLVSANLTGGAVLSKTGDGTLTLSGNNSGLTGVTPMTVTAGTLILDYSTSNTTKLRSLSGLTMNGGHVALQGNASAATLQTVAALALPTGGASSITLTPGGAQDVALDIGGISRTIGGSSIRFNLPTGVQTATNGILTSAVNINGFLGGYATVNNGVTTGFATNSGGNIVLGTSTSADDVSTWVSNDNVTDSAGYFGTVDYFKAVNTIRFNAAAASTVTLSTGAVLDVASGGILQTSSVVGGDSTITGGLLKSSTSSELIFTTDSAANPLIVGSMVNGNTAISKSGIGTLLLNGSNSYTGNTYLNQGVLRVSGGNAIGDSSILTINTTSSSTFELLANETIGGLATGGVNNTVSGTVAGIQLNGNALTLNQAAPGTFSGPIAGTAAATLIKSGTETLTLTAVSPNLFGTLQVNSGQVVLQGNNANLSGLSAVILEGAGSLRLASANQSNGDRIANSATVLLNNTISGSGLAFFTSDDAASSETVGALTLGAGHNLITAEASDAVSGSIVFDSLAAVNNHATALVRGNDLGATSLSRGRLIFTNAPGGALAPVGGTGTPTTQHAILPYLVGDVTAAGLGNSFVRNQGAAGLRPLAVGEYVTDETAFNALTGAALDNVRFATNPALALTSTATAINSLVLDGASAITLDGPGNPLEITSGALLSAQAVGNTIQNTFTAITTGGSRDYTVYVTNPTGSLTLNTSLTSTVPLVKSGAGTLNLGSASNLFTDLYLNQGAVQADALNKLGTGNLKFFGGTLKFGTAFDPTSTKTITLGTGGGTIDTNALAITFANAIAAGAGGLSVTGAGSLTLGAAAGYTGSTAIANGRLNLNGGATISTAKLTVGSGSTSGVLQLGDAVNGVTNQSFSELSTSGTGTANAIVGGGASVSALTINQTTNTTFTGAIGGLGTNENNLSIAKAGVGNLTLATGPFTHSGATTVTGGSLIFTGAVDGTSSLSVSGTGTTLALNGGITTPSAITSVTVGNGGTLNLLDGAGNKLSDLASLSLGGTGNGHIFLNFNVGDSVTAGDGLNTDTLTVATGGTITLFNNNKITFNITDTGLSAMTNYVLLDATNISGGLTLGNMGLSDYLLGITPSGFTSFSLSSSTDNQVILTTGSLITGNLYWRGLTDATWNGAADNWSTDKAGAVASLSSPGAGTDVVFQWDAPTNDPVFTNLGQNYKINTLTFEASTTPANTATEVTISGSQLEIAPQVATDGIDLAAGGPALAVINSVVKLGVNQTWNVEDAASNLTVNGNILGTGTLNKTGAGTLNLVGAKTFTNGLTISEGTVIGTLSNVAFGTGGTVTLGAASGIDSATLQVNTTGLNYANPIALGGTSGALTIGTPVNAASINTTFSGGVTGSNNLVIKNQSLAGTTTFSTNSLNNAGTITNTSSSTGLVTVSSIIGTNVTEAGLTHEEGRGFGVGNRD